MKGEPALILTFETEIITLNEYIEAERLNKFKAAKIKQALTSKIKLLTMAQTRQQLTGKYDLVIDWYRKTNRHDPDNIYFGIKFLNDGISAAKVIPNDNQTHIRNIHNNLHQHQKNMVVIRFYDTKR